MPKNEYSISSSNINTLLDGSTFADFTTYVTYSYLNSEKGDGIVYEDGKDTLSTNPINDICSDIVYNAKGSNVETTIVNGNILMENRKIEQNEVKIFTKCKEIINRIK